MGFLLVGGLQQNTKTGAAGCGVIAECFEKEVEIAAATLHSYWVEDKLMNISLLRGEHFST